MKHKNTDTQFKSIDSESNSERVMSAFIERMEKLNKPIFCTLSTVDAEGEPWGSPVYFGYDLSGIYWTSSVDAQHSKNIRLNQKVSVTLFQEGLSEGEGSGKGLYLQGHATELYEIKDIIHAKTVTAARLNKVPKNFDQYTPGFPRRVYRFIPINIFENSVVNSSGHLCDIRKSLI